MIPRNVRCHYLPEEWSDYKAKHCDRQNYEVNLQQRNMHVNLYLRMGKIIYQLRIIITIIMIINNKWYEHKP